MYNIDMIRSNIQALQQNTKQTEEYLYSGLQSRGMTNDLVPYLKEYVKNQAAITLVNLKINNPNANYSPEQFMQLLVSNGIVKEQLIQFLINNGAIHQVLNEGSVLGKQIMQQGSNTFNNGFNNFNNNGFSTSNNWNSMGSSRYNQSMSNTGGNMLDFNSNVSNSGYNGYNGDGPSRYASKPKQQQVTNFPDPVHHAPPQEVVQPVPEKQPNWLVSRGVTIQKVKGEFTEVGEEEIPFTLRPVVTLQEDKKWTINSIREHMLISNSDLGNKSIAKCVLTTDLSWLTDDNKDTNKIVPYKEATIAINLLLSNWDGLTIDNIHYDLVDLKTHLKDTVESIRVREYLNDSIEAIKSKLDNNLELGLKTTKSESLNHVSMVNYTSKKDVLVIYVDGLYEECSSLSSDVNDIATLTKYSHGSLYKALKAIYDQEQFMFLDIVILGLNKHIELKIHPNLAIEPEGSKKPLIFKIGVVKK